MPASFLIAVLLARHSDSLLAVFDRAVHGRSVRSARFLSQIDFRTTRARPHQGIAQQIPSAPPTLNTTGPIRCRNVLGGIIHDYYREAA
jgi:hypothetical protein